MEGATKMVSSPAMVPATSAKRDSSMPRATAAAAPARVWITTIEPIPGVEIGALSEAAATRRQHAADQIAAAATANNTDAAATSRQDWALWQSDLAESCTLARNLAKALADGDPAAAPFQVWRAATL